MREEGLLKQEAGTIGGGRAGLEKDLVEVGVRTSSYLCPKTQSSSRDILWSANSRASIGIDQWGLWPDELDAK
ncbi:15996_t:CDS:2, partial [Rhizophagus irregularis]